MHGPGQCIYNSKVIGKEREFKLRRNTRRKVLDNILRTKLFFLVDERGTRKHLLKH